MKYIAVFDIPDDMTGTVLTGSGKMIDIRTDVPGLWCDDITFCPEKCGWKSCPRNKLNIRDRAVPHSFSVEIPGDCPKQLESKRR